MPFMSRSVPLLVKGENKFDDEMLNERKKERKERKRERERERQQGHPHMWCVGSLWMMLRRKHHPE